MSGHHPTVLTAGRHGSWASCSCGWNSDGYRNGMASSLAWALHMADRALRRRGAAQAIADEEATEAALDRAHWWNQGAKMERRHLLAESQDADTGSRDQP